MDALSQLDELVESDILDALGENADVNKIELEDLDQEISLENFDETPIPDKNDITKIITQTGTNELVSLLSQLLNNKTIEITIKIKD